MTAVAAPNSGGAQLRRAESLRSAAGRLLLPLATAIIGVLFYMVLTGSDDGVDTRFAYWSVSSRILHGASPYLWSTHQLEHSFAFVYPALSAVLLIPVSLVSASQAAAIGMIVCLALAPLTLWLLGVRDLRVYGVALLWMPVFGAWQTANETMVLVFGLACAWHWRQRPFISSVLIAVLVSLKPMMWPLVLWPLATRRWRRLGYVAVVGVTLNCVAWLVVGFDQIEPFVQVAAADTDVAWRTGYGVMALLSHIGVGRAVGEGVAIAGAAALVVTLWLVGRDRTREPHLLVLLIALILVASPLVWGHYLSFLLIPAAVLVPRLSWLWFMPVLMWVCPPSLSVHAWQALVVWLAAASVFVALTRRAANPHRAAAGGW